MAYHVLTITVACLICFKTVGIFIEIYFSIETYQTAYAWKYLDK